MGDVESKGRGGIAKATLAFALKVFPHRRAFGEKLQRWKKFLDPGTSLRLMLCSFFDSWTGSLNAILEHAVLFPPSGDGTADVGGIRMVGPAVFGARDFLEKAFNLNPENE